MGRRHGGNGGETELADAEATDAEIYSISGHDPAGPGGKMRRVYARRTRTQALNAARKRRALRTDKG